MLAKLVMLSMFGWAAGIVPAIIDGTSVLLSLSPCVDAAGTKHLSATIGRAAAIGHPECLTILVGQVRPTPSGTALELAIVHEAGERHALDPRLRVDQQRVTAKVKSSLLGVDRFRDIVSDVPVGRYARDVFRIRTRMASEPESKSSSPLRRADADSNLAWAFAIAVAVAEIALDLGTWVELDIASIYGIPLVLSAFTRNRRLLWGLTIALALATFIAYALQIPAAAFEAREGLFVNRLLDAVALLVTAGLVHVWMTSMDIREAQAQMLAEQNRKLGLANELLVAHEVQIVCQNEELNRRRQDAEEASGRKTRLLNAVSHDIRNPVNTIHLMAEVIRRTAEDPAGVTQVPQMARRLQSTAHSLVALVSQVLDIAHLDSGHLQLSESTFSLNEFIDSKRRDLAPLAEAKSLSFDSETPERIVRLRTDRIKLDRIITNLVTNAIKFTSSGSVTISTATALDGRLAIGIRDTGVGIPGHEVEHIFDEFTQFNVPLGKLNGGWGLGLAISRRLANFIGADIIVESELGRGTVFMVMLPAECVVDIAPALLPGAS